MPRIIDAGEIAASQMLKDPAERNMAPIRQIGIDYMNAHDSHEGHQAFMEDAGRNSRPIARLRAATRVD